MLIGAHVSVAGGLTNGLAYAAEVGAECIQFFAKSPRQWRGPAHDTAGAEAFRAAREQSAVKAVFSHTAYLLNLSTTDDALRAKSVEALVDEMVRASLIGADGLVTHVGNAPDGDHSAAAMRTASSILAAYERAGEAGSTVRLLLENTAGSGSSFGCDFAQLAAAIDGTGMGADRLGVCFDTCHGFAYGMPLDSEDGWSQVLGELDAAVGLERLGLIHVNDCMFERGSRRDRHAWIGDGFIGTEGFRAMLCAEVLKHVPGVTEMPGEKPVKDLVNLERLRELRDECGPSQ